MLSVKKIQLINFSYLRILCFALMAFSLLSCSSSDKLDTVNGFVLSGNLPIESSAVTLYVTGTGQGPGVLGEAVSDATGFFSISYRAPTDQKAVLYLTADSAFTNLSGARQNTGPDFIRLATVLGQRPVPTQIVINERTTIATSYAMAQFITPVGIGGKEPGLQNAALILRNLVDIETGDIGLALGTFPNGVSTTTMATLNSLANMLAACVRTESECSVLFSLATPPQGNAPTNTFRAAVNIAHFPWQNVESLLALSLQQPLYVPALATGAELNAWTLAIRYDGNGQELNGPGNIAFDKDGNAWITNNYVFDLDPLDPQGKVCGDDHVLKFTPTGEDFPGAPYQGGGVYGVGFGITLDPDGNVWVGNFGFQGTNCPFDIEELSQTVSKFASDGTPISPNSQGNESGQDHGGFKGAGNAIRQPQGTVSDTQGNIWIANCSGDSVIQFPGGDPDEAFVIAPEDGTGTSILSKPFDIAIDTMGNAWVTNNANDSVLAFDTDGNLLHSISGTEASDAGISFPMGIASDSLGNVWVSNSGFIRTPCDGSDVPSLAEVVFLILAQEFIGRDASITMIESDGTPAEDAPYKGGGLLLPWGIAVDGHDNVWVANFEGKRVSHFCGAVPENCPPGFSTGDPISPEGGYNSDALVRNTGVAIDPSGNVWLTNNWEILAVPQNPGGHEIVVFIGLAKPVKTPLIGSPKK